jgi:hypothetical protein
MTGIIFVLMLKKFEGILTIGINTQGCLRNLNLFLVFLI